MHPIYLDNSATTPVHPNVQKSIKDSFKYFANPSSPHSFGKKAREEIENARKEIAKFINAQPEEIIFTSGATESNNLAIKGLVEEAEKQNKNHIITSQIEHPAVLETLKSLEKKFKIDYISTNEEGLININELKSKITPKTFLVSIMHVNNEIGTIQPIAKIAKICKAKKIYFHTDAVQSFTKLPIDVKKQNIDLLSASGHKINAPKGIGFLYVKNGTNISQIIHGGGQEKKLRSGTENTLGILSLKEAIKLKRQKKQTEKTRNLILKELLKIPESRLNGSKKNRTYNNINISFYGIEGESLLMKLDKKGILVSTGSACSSKKLSQSHVLKAIKTPTMYINGSIRITLSDTEILTKKQTDFIIKTIKNSVNELKKISPFKFKEEK